MQTIYIMLTLATFRKKCKIREMKRKNTQQIASWGLVWSTWTSLIHWFEPIFLKPNLDSKIYKLYKTDSTNTILALWTFPNLTRITSDLLTIEWPCCLPLDVTLASLCCRCRHTWPFSPMSHIHFLTLFLSLSLCPLYHIRSSCIFATCLYNNLNRLDNKIHSDRL